MSSLAAPHSVTQLLNAWSQGQDEALERLVPHVYADLRRMARRRMQSERGGHVLQSTALVHEAFIRLGQQRGMHWASRTQFFNWMSTVMRHILIDHARHRGAAKRGGGAVEDSLEAMQEAMHEAGGEEETTVGGASSDDWLGLLRLNEALEHLEQLDPRQGRVVELRFFGGLTVEQTAEALQVSAATVKREWSTARLWLLHELQR